MVEITKIEKILTDKNEMSDFVLITFITDLGNTHTARYPIQDVSDNSKMKQYVYEKAQFYDAKDSFSPITDRIEISKDDLNPIDAAPSEESIFLNAINELELWNQYLELGLITEIQYTAKLSEVKKLAPLGYFALASTKE